MGIAKRLLQKIIETAITLNITRLETAASIMAKPFFEKQSLQNYSTANSKNKRYRVDQLQNGASNLKTSFTNKTQQYSRLPSV